MAMKTIFYHGHNFTVALNISEKLCLKSLGGFWYDPDDGQESEYDVGVAFVHPKDQFCRATGRKVSVQKQTNIPFKILALKFNYNRIYGLPTPSDAQLEMAGKLPNGKTLFLTLGFRNNFVCIDHAYYINEDYSKVFPESADKKEVTSEGEENGKNETSDGGAGGVPEDGSVIFPVGC